MSSVGLLYVGAVLFVNGLMLLGKVEGKSAGVFNLFVGALQVIAPMYVIISNPHDSWTILQASGTFLFGFTYLYVGINNLCDLNATGFGWYSLWVSIMAVGYSMVTFIHFNDYKFGIIWLMWSFLWFLFFRLLALNKDIGRFTGWVTMIQSWFTATLPAFLSLIGVWTELSAIVIAVATAAVVASIVILYFSTKTFKKKHASLDVSAT
ncbi:transporter [Bacillus sp. V3-13]|uniref:AmiS/UreI family transporter n=1 Tax=Bacillus sp. V3-13 TaxID=2053728 RepID=UPI000C769349|nr:AmiS/UreI family transporter [Bacillus sp. V3-13]PLR76324.1 transporter [Bacillus sp. V3-13]